MTDCPTARSAFWFEAAGVKSKRLADVVRGRDFDLDVSTLAARILGESPIEEGATPYVGVHADFIRTDELPAYEGPPSSSPETAATSLRRAMDLAVAHSLRGVRRAAVLTGGGVDSSALLALAQDWARRNDATVFGTAMDFGGDGDDRPYLTALERHLGCEVIRTRPEDAARRVEHFCEGADAAPLAWSSAPMEIEALARAKAHGAEVVLTGIGADELFDGEPRSLARLARRHPVSALRSARSMRGFWRPRSPTWSWIVRPSLGAALPSVIRRWRQRPRPEAPPAWAGRVLRGAVRRHEAARREAHRSAPRVWDPPHHEHLAWLRHQEDVCAGIECRSVFLERSMRSLVASFRPEWLLHGSIRRGLFREAVRDLLPPSIVLRADKARFNQGLLAWLLAAGGFDRLRPLASGDRLASLELVEADAFRKAFEAFERAPSDGEIWSSLWPPLAVEAFLRAHDRRRAESARG